MDPKELAQLMKMPQGAVYTRALGTVGAAMYAYTEMQMAEYALAHKLYERDKWRKVLAESCADERSQLWEAGPGGGCSRAITAEADVQRLRAALEMAVRQNEHDMLMTGEELRACRAALAGLGA